MLKLKPCDSGQVDLCPLVCTVLTRTYIHVHTYLSINNHQIKEGRISTLILALNKSCSKFSASSKICIDSAGG